VSLVVRPLLTKLDNDILISGFSMVIGWSLAVLASLRLLELILMSSLGQNIIKEES
jgi:hypothetical protein